LFQLKRTGIQRKSGSPYGEERKARGAGASWPVFQHLIFLACFSASHLSGLDFCFIVDGFLLLPRSNAAFQVLLPCAAAYTTGPFRVPQISRQSTAFAKCTPSPGLRSAESSRIASLRMVAAAATSQLPSAEKLKTSQLSQLAAMTVLSIDTGDLDIVKEFAATGYITDATTNPLFVSQAGLSGDPRYTLLKFSNKVISCQQRLRLDLIFF
jgi:hypothetical protein